MLVPDSEGRLTPAADELIYPSEAITNGLRIEYTSVLKPFVSQDPETTADSSLTEVTGTSINETTHVNLNKMLSLAVVEFIKAKSAERKEDIQKKEYYMKQYYKHLADNESNLKKIFITGTQPVFSLK